MTTFKIVFTLDVFFECWNHNALQSDMYFI